MQYPNMMAACQNMRKQVLMNHRSFNSRKLIESSQHDWWSETDTKRQWEFSFYDFVESFASGREEADQEEVEEGVDLSELESVVERGDVAQRHSDGHGAKRGEKQRPRRIALDEGNALRAQKVHNEGLPHMNRE